jgi:hypothetical protein
LEEVGAQSDRAIQTLTSLVTESGTALSTVGRRLDDQLGLFREQMVQNYSSNRELTKADHDSYLSGLAQLSIDFSAEVERQQGEISLSVEQVRATLRTGFSDISGAAEEFASALSRLEVAILPARKSMSSLEVSANNLVTQLRDLREKAGIPSEIGSDGEPGSALSGRQEPVEKSFLKKWLSALGRESEDDVNSAS